MMWFKKHLNWAWAICFLFILLILSLFASYFTGIKTEVYSFAMAWIILPVNAWILHCKGRSAWFLLLSYFIIFVPLILNNKRNIYVGAI
jgi:hypothetical protein